MTARASVHRLCVSVSALFSLANAAASPDQSGEKSPLPRFSAASRNGATAPAANGNGGASRQMGPAPATNRLRSPRAGRPVNTFVNRVASSRALASAARWIGEMSASGVRR